jgi:predicted dehydrogenase
MGSKIARRDVLKSGAAIVAATTAGGRGEPAAAQSQPIRIGIVGTGNRGRSLLSILVSIPDVQVPALCDTNCANLALAREMVEKSGRRKPEGYSDGPEHFQKLMGREDLDAVVIATPWDWHTPMAVHAMRSGKYVAVEVPVATSFEECWELVNTHEQTGIPCMMLENWSFRQDNLAVLNMIREGLLGTIVHCHCAHSHDCIDHWFFNPQGDMRWGGRFLLRYNRDQYPTHALGPVVSWMNLGCGDYFESASSVASRSLGINAYFTRKFGPDHPNAKLTYSQGDIVTTQIKTRKGNTIVVNYDMQLPRPYDNRWMIQGTLGLYNESRDAVYLTGRSPKYHEWEPFPPYMAKYDHAWWRAMKDGAQAASHGGTDYLELGLFLKAVRERSQTPIDVYDSVLMSSVIPLSQKSIEQSGAPVTCPDFTRGRWESRKPSFAL